MPLPPAPPLPMKPKERRELEAVVTKPTMPQRTVRRARILLEAASGVPNAEIARHVGIARTHVVQTRRRFEERGIESVHADAPGRGRPKLISDSKVAKIVETVLEKKPRNATHWSSRDLASRHGVSFSSIQRILRAHNLQPHRVQNFKFSKDPKFVETLRDIVGLYMAPPTNAIVLSVDEKSSVQALERTAPILPLRAGVPACQTHDYRRNGTTTLFAALNTLNGKVIERLPRHRHIEFVEFLDHIDQNVSSRLDVHLIMVITQRTNIPSSKLGLQRVRATTSTSHRRVRRGSTPSNVSLQISQRSGSAAEPLLACINSSARFLLTSPTTIRAPSRLSGPSPHARL